MACEINIGKFKVHPDKVAEALSSVEGVSDFDTAAVRSYTKVEEDVGFPAWTRYLESVWETVPRSRSITDKDLFGDIAATEEVKELKDILNMKRQEFETVRGKVESTLSPEAVLAIAQWKKHLLNRGRPLTVGEAKTVLTTLRSVIKSGQRVARIDQLRNTAKSALKNKIGSAEAVKVFRKLFNVDPKYIRNFEGLMPEGYTKAEMIADYNYVIQAVGQRKKILDIGPEMKDLNAKANKIIGALGTSPKKVELIIDDDPVQRRALLGQFESLLADPSSLTLRNEREVVEDINALQTVDLEVLTNQEIAHLIDGIKSINAGLFQSEISKIIKKVYDANVSKEITNVFRNTEDTDWVNSLSRAYGSIASFISGREKFATLFRGRSVAYAGTVTGDRKNTLFTKVGRKLAVAVERSQTEKSGLYDRHDVVSDLLLGKDRPKKIYTTAVLAFIEQNESNEDQYSADELVDAFITDGLNSSSLTSDDINLMKDIKKEFSVNGKLDKAKLLAAVEADKGMSALRAYNKENGEQLVEKLIHTTATERGTAVPILVDQAPISVLWSKKDGSVDPSSSFARKLHPSVSSSQSKERVKTKRVPVVDFDLLTASSRAAAEIITDYHLTPALKVAYNTAETAVETLVAEGATDLQLAAAKGWREFIQAEVESIVAANAENYSFFADVGKFLLKASYTSKLLRGEKIFSELAGNLGWWGIQDPGAWIRGTKSDALFMKDLNVILHNIGSVQAGKITSKGNWGGRAVDSTWLKTNDKRKANRGMNKVQRIAAQSSKAGKHLKYVPAVADKIADLGLAGPDKATTRPGFLGVFEREFEKLTGVKLKKAEYELIAINDEAFMTKHRASLTAAMTQADDVSIKAASTSNSVAAVAKFKKDAKDKLGTQFYKVAAGYLMSFSVNEGAAWKYYFRGMAGREDMSRTKAAQGAAATLVRMAAYRPMMTAFAIFMGYLGLGEDEEEEKTWALVWSQFTRDLLGSYITLTTQRMHGGWVRTPFAIGTEYINEHYLGFTRDNEDYDSFEHGLSFSLVRERDLLDYRTSVADIAARFIGPAGSVVKDAEHLWKLMRDKHANTDEIWDDFFEEILLLTAAYSNMLPFYRDIVNKRRNARWAENDERKKKEKGRSRSKRKKKK